jgi:hypothetical protein
LEISLDALIRKIMGSETEFVSHRSPGMFLSTDTISIITLDSTKCVPYAAAVGV